MTAAPPVRLALLGCGWIARNRVRQIAESGLAEIVALVDTDAEARQALEPWTRHAVHLDHLDRLDDEAVDGVMISTPSALHSAQALALIERRLPVFVQKPIAIGASEAARVLGAADQWDLPVATDLCYRHLHGAVALRDAVSRGEVGTPFCVEAWFHNAFRPGAVWSHDLAMAGGGALMDLGVHLLDLVMWTLDQPLVLRGADLRRRGRCWRAGEVEDFAALNLSFGQDGQARMLASWDASTGRDAEIGMRIYGEYGNLEIVNREGSFFDFDARLCRGRQVTALASDDTDAWQAGPLSAWLEALRGGVGYQHPAWVEASLSLIDQSYALARARENSIARYGALQ